MTLYKNKEQVGSIILNIAAINKCGPLNLNSFHIFDKEKRLDWLFKIIRDLLADIGKNFCVTESCGCER